MENLPLGSLSFIHFAVMSLYFQFFGFLVLGVCNPFSDVHAFLLLGLAEGDILEIKKSIFILATPVLIPSFYSADIIPTVWIFILKHAISTQISEK